MKTRQFIFFTQLFGRVQLRMIAWIDAVCLAHQEIYLFH